MTDNNGGDSEHQYRQAVLAYLKQMSADATRTEKHLAAIKFVIVGVLLLSILVACAGTLLG